MRKILISFLFIVIAFFAGCLVSQKVAAQTPATSKPGGLCYAQCGAYKFYWKGDFCYDMMITNCTASFNLKDVVSMLKSIRDGFISGKLTEIVDVKPIFTAWLICKPLIQDCIAPQLSACQTACEQEPTLYAPNLTVGSNWGGSFQGLYYDENKKTLSMRVMNTGLGYASDIKVSLTTMQTSNQDDSSVVSGTTTTETIPELLFFGSRQAAPKTVNDTITDFLIDQSRFHNWLAQYKSDANNVYIPPGWEKTISIAAPDGMLTRFILKVDPDNQIIETSEYDNTYILDVDKRPKPPGFAIKDIKITRNSDSLTDYTVEFTISNNGDLDGTANLTIYKGIDSKGETVASGTVNVSAHRTAIIQKTVSVDVSKGSPLCAILQNFTAAVADDKGKSIDTPTNFSIPIYAGAISGRVTDSAGKAVAGAVITASNGKTATSGDSGYYRIDGIGALGKITLTFEHPDFSQKITQEVNISFNETNSIGGCNVSGLSQQLNVVMRDQPLLLHLRLKSSPGPLVNGQVIFTGGAGTFTYEVPGEKDVSEMQPGQFRVTAMAAGFTTKEVEVVLTPPEQTVEIVLEPLWGRPNDEGLTLITPVKLWEKVIDKGKIDAIAGSKDGKLLVVNTNDTTNRSGGPGSWTGKLTFINPIDGTIIKSVTVPFNVGQAHVALAVSYDGRTVGYMYSTPDPKAKTSFVSFIKLFNASGDSLGEKSMGKSAAVKIDVSADGFYLYPSKLMNSSLYTYTRQEMEGKGGSDPKTYSANEDLHFLRNNNLVAGCKEGQCILNLAGAESSILGKIHGVSRVIDSSFNNGTIIIRGDDKLYFYSGSSWNKDAVRDPGFVSAAVSPGGEYTVVAKGPSGSNSLLVFDKSGRDATPQFDYQNVRLVEANDRGIFYSSVVSNKLTYYQLGKYQTEYTHPQTQSAGETTFGGMQEYVNMNDRFEDVAYLLTWDRMYPYSMYKATQKVSIATSWGSLTVGEGTIFGKDGNGWPILLWGQAEVNATTPITMTVLKNKLLDNASLQSKMEKLFSGTLSDKDFVLIQNLHTKYSVSTQNGAVSVLVSSGSVNVSSSGNKQQINSGQIAEIKDSGTVEVKTNWLIFLPWLLLIVIICGLAFVYWKYRNTKLVKKIVSFLRKIIKLSKKKNRRGVSI